MINRAMINRAMMKRAFLAATLITASAFAADKPTEDYVRVAAPPGIQVVGSELDGPVFADAQGRTLYSWPSRHMRNGYTGDPKSDPQCTGVKTTTNAGLMSPYPPGLELPELDRRPSCIEMWPVAVAPADARPIGAWTIVTRKDGVKQWAYDEHPLYTSVFDKAPGDVLGGTTRRGRGAVAAPREPISPPPRVPPGFAVITTSTGRMVITGEKRQSLYTFDRDTASKFACTGTCLQEWTPVAAPDTARAVGEWTVVEREYGSRQWAFRKKPVYVHVTDTERASREGSDVPGWHNVFTQIVSPPPREFTMQESDSGTVLADAHGRTIYIYGCGDDSQDQLACDHPDTVQTYRFAMCGAGDPKQCVANWPYVLADKNARSQSRLWTTMDIDPMTGHRVGADAPGALHVWAYRDRPVYTFAKDAFPGDTYGDGRGEFNGHREGFKAFWLRDDYFGNAS